MIDPKTRTIRCTYAFSKQSRCLTEADHFYRITTSRITRYEARCGLHYKGLVKAFEQDHEHIEEIPLEIFIVEPVMES